MKLTTTEGGGGAPESPDWQAVYDDPLDVATAAEMWTEVVQAMTAANTISPANGPMIARLVRFRIEFDRAARDVAANGTKVRAPRSSVPMSNPSWAIMRQANEAVTGLEAELGIPPVRRGKAVRVAQPRAWRPADRFLKPVSR